MGRIVSIAAMLLMPLEQIIIVVVAMIGDVLLSDF